MKWEKNSYGVVIKQKGNELLGEVRSVKGDEFRIWFAGELAIQNGKIGLRGVIFTRHAVSNPEMRRAGSKERQFLENIIAGFNGLKTFLGPTRREFKKIFRDRDFLAADEILKILSAVRTRKSDAQMALSKGRRNAEPGGANSLHAVSGGLPEGGKRR